MNRCVLISITILLIALQQASGITPEKTLKVQGDRLSGVVLPVLPRASNIQIRALRADSWTVDDTKRLFLKKDITVSIGGFTFNANEAIIWINRLPTDAGVVSQIAIYLPTFAKSSKLNSMAADGENLLVVGSTLGDVTLDVALFNPKKISNQINRIAEERLAGYIQALLEEPQKLTNYPQVQIAENFIFDRDDVKKIVVPKNETLPWLKPSSGFLSIAADLVELKTNEIENAITLSGNVQLAMNTPSKTEDLQMNATSGVVFLNPGSLREIASSEVNISDIHGVYLEGNVVVHAEEGNYLIRAPKIYYDFKTGKATMVEAVLRTYIKDGQVPLYIRADELKQIAENQWVGDGIQASTSSFATPNLAIGATSMEITQQADGNTFVKSKGNTLRLGGMPIMYWPKYEGHAGKIPLRRVNIGNTNNQGNTIETRWDLFTLLGKDAPRGISSDLHIDGYADRGVGLGLNFDYQLNKNIGLFDLYLLSDSGSEKTDSGRTIDVTRNERGHALWKHELEFDNDWRLQMQASYISDPTYMSTWRKSNYRTDFEYETSIYAKQQTANNALTLLVKNDVNNFISNSWLMASRQYKVDKFPQISYFSYGNSLLDGLINYSIEAQLMRERMIFQPGTPDELGLRSNAFTFPDGTTLGGNQQIESTLTERGLRSEYRNRFVSRQAISVPIQLGAIKLVPFASMQSQFGFNNDSAIFSGEQDPWIRSVGIRASTQFQRVYNDIDNQLLDLHRLRHVIEPYATLWDADSNVNPTTLAQYDGFIDNLSIGTAMWFGVRNRLQTWRGGPGRWYQIDWLSFDAAVLFANEGATQRYDNPQFFTWKPEYSSLHDAIVCRGKWQYSDSVAFIGSGAWELDDNNLSRGAIGAELDHGRDIKTSIEYRKITNSDDQFLNLSFNYQLNKRYKVLFQPRWNFTTDDFQAVNFSLTRHYPEFDLISLISYNEIQDETNYGFRLNLKKF